MGLMEQKFGSTIPKLVPFLTLNERGRVRSTCSNSDARSRDIPFARAIRISAKRDRVEAKNYCPLEEGWHVFEWPQFKALVPRVNLDELRLLNVDLKIVKSPHVLRMIRLTIEEWEEEQDTEIVFDAPFVELDEILDVLRSLPTVRLVFVVGQLCTFRLKSFISFLESIPEWAGCDRWRVRAHNEDIWLKGLPRMVYTTSDESRNPDWLEVLHIDSSTIYKVGVYPLLRKLIVRDVSDDVVENLCKWLKSSSTPILSVIQVASKLCPLLRDVCFTLGWKDLWLGEGLLIYWDGTSHLAQGGGNLLSAIEHTKGKARLHKIILPYKHCGHELEAFEDDKWKKGLKALQFDNFRLGTDCSMDLSEYRWITRDAINEKRSVFTNLRVLTIGCFAMENVDEWHALFDPSALPALKVLNVKSFPSDDKVVMLFSLLNTPAMSGLTTLFVQGAINRPLLENLPNVRLPNLCRLETRLQVYASFILTVLEAPLRMIYIHHDRDLFEDVEGLVHERFPKAQLLQIIEPKSYFASDSEYSNFDFNLLARFALQSPSLGSDSDDEYFFHSDDE